MNMSLRQDRVSRQNSIVNGHNRITFNKLIVCQHNNLCIARADMLSNKITYCHEVEQVNFVLGHDNMSV